MVTVNTLSSIQGDAGENKTFTSVSTNIIIKVGDNPVGAIRSMSVNEARTIAQIDEVGTDGHVDDDQRVHVAQRNEQVLDEAMHFWTLHDEQLVPALLDTGVQLGRPAVGLDARLDHLG